jgi:hypothetical protein
MRDATVPGGISPDSASDQSVPLQAVTTADAVGHDVSRYW